MSDLGFFPTDVLLGDASKKLKLEFLKVFIKSETLASLILELSELNENSQFFVDGINDANNKYLASKYNHEGDIVWIYKELKAVLSVWDKSNEILGSVEAKDMVYRLVATLSEKIEEFE